MHGMWFPTVRRVLVCLSKLYRCIDVSYVVFACVTQSVLQLEVPTRQSCLCWMSVFLLHLCLSTSALHSSHYLFFKQVFRFYHWTKQLKAMILFRKQYSKVCRKMHLSRVFIHWFKLRTRSNQQQRINQVKKRYLHLAELNYECCFLVTRLGVPDLLYFLT